jgi:pyrroline-5-carboxylate reductase
MSTDLRFGLIGSGNMARAMARGWGDPVLVSDTGSGRAQALSDELGGEAFSSNLEVAQRADVLILCHKPYHLQPVADQLRPYAKVVVSVLGGTSTATVQDCYPDAQVFAVMPNTPVEVNQGVLVYADAERQPRGTEPQTGVTWEVDQQTQERILEHFARIGTVIRVPERLFGAANSLSGVGPAYQALLVEAQIDAGVRHGLAADLAAQLVLGTIKGTAALLEANHYDTLAVRRGVTSPGGSTARGLNALEHAGVRNAFQDAADAVANG